MKSFLATTASGGIIREFSPFNFNFYNEISTPAAALLFIRFKSPVFDSKMQSQGVLQFERLNG